MKWPTQYRTKNRDVRARSTWTPFCRMSFDRNPFIIQVKYLTDDEGITENFTRWLIANAATYGFSAEDQDDDWHWRYVAGDYRRDDE